MSNAPKYHAGKKPVGWRKKQIPSQLESKTRNIATDSQLFNAIKTSMIAFVNAMYGNANDQKYRNYVDLLMFEIKSELSNLSLNDLQLDEQTLHDAIFSAFDSLSFDNDEQITLNALSDKILPALKKIVESSIKKENAELAQPSKTDNSRKPAKKFILKSKSSQNETQRAQIMLKNASIVNNAIIKISSIVDKSFKRIQQMMTQHFAIMSLSGSYEDKVVNTLEKINSLSLKMAIVPSGGALKKKNSKKKMKSIDVVVNGMKFNTQMIDTLSTDAIKSTIYTATTIKSHYERLLDKLLIVEKNISQNLEYTNQTIDSITETGFEKWIKKFYNNIVDYVKKNILDPLKEIVKKWLLDKLPECMKALWSAIQRFVNIAKAVFTGLQKTFKFIWGKLKKIFSIAIRAFKKLMRGLTRGVIWVVKGIIKLIRLALIGIYKILAWFARKIKDLIKRGWKKFMSSRFGQKVKKIFDKITKPFKAIKKKMSAFKNAIKKKFTKAKTLIKNGIKRIGNGIKKYVGKVVDFAKKLMSKVMSKISSVVTKFVRGFKGMFVRMWNKIPGRKFLKRMATKVVKKLGIKWFRKRATEKIGKSLGKKIGTAMVKMLGKAAASGPAVILTAISIAYTIYDLFKTYQSLKKLLRPIAAEMGYNVNEVTTLPDGTQTTDYCWFEKFLWSEAKKFFNDYIMTGKLGDFMEMIYNAVLDDIKRGFREVHILFDVADERMDLWRQNWTIYNQLKDKFNPKVTNVKEFFNKLISIYQHITKIVVQLQKSNEAMNKINDQYDEIPKQIKEIEEDIEYYEETGKERSTKAMKARWKKEELEREYDSLHNRFLNEFRNTMYKTGELIKYAMMGGIHRIMDYIDIYKHHRNSMFKNEYAWNKFPEKRLDIALRIYKLAYAGLTYLEYIKYKDEVKKYKKERVSQLKQMNENCEFNIDTEKLAELCQQYQNEFNGFYQDVDTFNTEVMGFGTEELNRLIEGLEDQDDEEDEEENVTLEEKDDDADEWETENKDEKDSNDNNDEEDDEDSDEEVEFSFG